MRILLVEDFGPLRLSVSQRLREAGYAVDETADGEEGMALASVNNYSVAILDLMLPHSSGLEILKLIRRNAEQKTGVIIITAQDAVESRIEGLDAGADDYLVKPFDQSELIARVRALMRRCFGQTETVIQVGDLEVDLGSHGVTKAGQAIELTPKEFSLLELLVLRQGQLVRRSDAWEQLYEYDAQTESNVVDVVIARLRKKLEQKGSAKLIHTKRGEGYILEARDS